MPPRPPSRDIALATLLILPLAACGHDAGGASGGAATTVRDSAGVRITESPPAALERELAWRLAETPSLVLGVLDGPPEETFTRVAAAFRLDDGRLVVQGGGTPPVAVFGPDGTFLNGVGGRGEGPGEWLSLGGVAAAGGDTLLVYDARARALLRYRADGAHLGRVALQALPRGLSAMPFGNPEHVGAGGVVLRMFPREEVEDGERAGYPFARFDPANGEATDLGTITGPVWRVHRVPSGYAEMGVADPAWREHPVVAADAGRFLAAPGEGFALQVRSPATGSQVGEYRVRADAPPDPDAPPAHGPLLVDALGYDWIQEFQHVFEEAPESRRWWIVDREGRFLGFLRLPGDHRLVHVSADEVFAEVHGELDVPELRILRLERR